MGCSPVIGYHYGARNTNELGNILSKSFKLLFITGTVMLAIGEFLAKPLSSFFVGYDTSLLILTVHAMKITTLCFIIVGINIFASSFFTALNNGWVSAIISLLRTFVFKLSFVILLPILIGIEGIWWSNTLSEIAAFIISMITLALMRKRYDY